ncbi:hypothetical protein Cpir12675_000803 [Ceratocystis pirilliformis]|uniref:Mitochondrial arginine transporter BAC2 n=1 Tax=Ceratocystis pirilliformis TaxID=259994 RepID=A0ABR3ZK74_9PEZI
MSSDFWAGYISGAVGIIIGNPLDILKVQLQAGKGAAGSLLPPSPQTASPAQKTSAQALRSLATGTAAPILGYGALNALLFVIYNRSEKALTDLCSPLGPDSRPPSPDSPKNLYITWLAGALGGLATWSISTPTELIKCRVQLAPPSTPVSSLAMCRAVLRSAGLRGLFAGGGVTALRDSVGYGFYFWAYELAQRYARGPNRGAAQATAEGYSEAARALLCGGVAGVVTWASIFPLDVIKTRVQAHPQLFTPKPMFVSASAETKQLQPQRQRQPYGRNMEISALQAARQAYAHGGMRVFFRGLGVCSVRAFVVNAVQWAVYEWVLREI